MVQQPQKQVQSPAAKHASAITTVLFLRDGGAKPKNRDRAGEGSAKSAATEGREWWLVTGMTDERPSDGLGRRSGDISYLQGKDERETLVHSLLR